MKNPQISVILPSYNAGEYLGESVESILNQTFKDFELIIIDDGSTDDSIEKIKKYWKDKRIIFLKNKKNIGLQKSLNKGLKHAKGRYIARMDSDDLFLPKRFEIQYKFLEENPEIFLVGGSAIVIDEFGRKIGILRKFNNYKKIRRNLEKRNCIIHPSIMFRNTKEFNYRENFKTSEDYDLYLRMLSLSKKITNLPNFLIKYRINKGSFVSTMPNQEFYFKKAKEFYQQRKKQNLDDYYKLLPPRKNIYPKNSEKSSLKSKVFIQFQDNQMKEVRKNILSSFKINGFDKKLAIYYLLSFVPIRIIFFINEKIL